MAFPFTIAADFEEGTLAASTFDAEVDTNGKLSIDHYSELARVPGLAMPWRGAYALHVDLAGGTAAAYLQDTDIDISAAAALFIRFKMWVDPNITMADTNEFAIFQLWSGTNTVEGVIAINYTNANGLRIGAGELTAAQFVELPTGRWVTVEMSVTIDAGGGNDGTIDLTVDGLAITQIGSLDQGAITSGVLGAIGLDAGTTLGHILFDQFETDDGSVDNRDVDRYPAEGFTLTKTGHVAVGPGEVDNLTLISGNGTDCTVKLYDTDKADVFNNPIAELANTAANEIVDPAGMPRQFSRGLYAVLAGTTPQANVKLGRATGYGAAPMRTIARGR